MEKTLGELVTFPSSHGLSLDGILFSDPRNTTTVLHVHGSFGNFYQSQFLRVMARKYMGAGINFLSFNTASHHGLAEGYRNGNEFEYVGGAVADFNECIFDIEGATTYASRFSRRIVLQGHSLGCDRILHFLISKQTRHDFILLSPCDSYQLQVNWIAPESVEQQIVRIKKEAPSDPEFDWLSSREYGVRQGDDWSYSIPITRKALLSIIEGPPCRLIKIQEPAKFNLDQRALTYIGGKDALQVWSNDVMFRYFQERIGNVTPVYVAHGDHMLGGCEAAVAEKVVDWLRA
jgi:hypothetical protein